MLPHSHLGNHQKISHTSEIWALQTCGWLVVIYFLSPVKVIQVLAQGDPSNEANVCESFQLTKSSWELGKKIVLSAWPAPVTHAILIPMTSVCNGIALNKLPKL